MLVKIIKSDNPQKKLKAIFYDDDMKKIKKIKTVHFGASKYSDYTIHKDDDRKKNIYSKT